MDLTDEVYRLSKLLPKEETFALSDQLRRAVVSVPSTIAEGYGRQIGKEFLHFLSVARGSVFEVETQLLISIRQNYCSESEASDALSLCDEVGRMLTSLSKSQNPDTRNEKLDARYYLQGGDPPRLFPTAS